MSWVSDIIDTVSDWVSPSESSNTGSGSGSGSGTVTGSPGPIVSDPAQQKTDSYSWGDFAKDAFKVVSPLIVSAVSSPGKVKYPEIPDSVKNDPRMQNLMGSYGFPNNFPVFKEPSLFQQNFPAMFQIATQTFGKPSAVDTNSAEGKKRNDILVDPETGNTMDTTPDPMLGTPFGDFINNNPDGSPELDKQTHPLSPSTAASLDSNYGELLDKAASDHKIDPVLLRSMVLAESGGNTTAVSKVGARGLGQLMPKTADWLAGAGRPLTRAELENPAINLNLTAKYIASLSKQFDGDYDKVISAYNAGPGAVESGKASRYLETRNYLKQVRNNYLRYTNADRKKRIPTIEDINSSAAIPQMTSPSSSIPAPGTPPLPGAVV